MDSLIGDDLIIHNLLLFSQMFLDAYILTKRGFSQFLFCCHLGIFINNIFFVSICQRCLEISFFALVAGNTNMQPSLH